MQLYKLTQNKKRSDYVLCHPRECGDPAFYQINFINFKTYMKYSLAIIGGGPAAVSAGIYASRKQLKTVFITENFGGQSIVSPSIENWIGTIKIPGAELANNLKNHLLAYSKDIVDVKEGEKAEKITLIKREFDGQGKIENGFQITTNKGIYEADAVLIAVGSKRKKLGSIGADTFEHKGVMYCASCDGPMFSGMDVAVVGGGNAGFETISQLTAYAKSVTMINRHNEYKADKVTVEKVLSNPKVTAIVDSEIVEIKGDTFVKSIVVKNNATGETKEIPMQGVFVEIGAIPNTDIVKDLVELNEIGAIKIDPNTQQTSLPGIWAAGDCTDVLYHQNNIAVGDGVKALEDIYVNLHTR
jgi:NADH-dependent peroxiredoxin subunit F